MRMITLLGLLLVGVPGYAALWNYPAAYSCLKALTTGMTVPGTPVIYTRNGLGVFALSHEGVDGFYVMTPQTAYFFPREEMTKSGDGQALQLKVTANIPTAEPPEIKIFFNPSGSAPEQQISFGTANEFDRHIDTIEAKQSSLMPAMNKMMGTALYKVRPLLQTNPKGLGQALGVCSKTDLDFNVDMGNGTEGLFATEVHKLQDKLKPGFFSMDHWFPKKETTSN